MGLEENPNWYHPSNQFKGSCSQKDYLFLSCKCKTNRGRACGYRKAGFQCSMICRVCNGKICGNDIKVTLDESDEDDLDLPLDICLSTKEGEFQELKETDIDPEIFTVESNDINEPELIVQEGNLVPCHVCGRTFLPTPLKKHEKICEKNAIKKRKPFDSLKQRVAGTDLADFHQPTYLKKKEEPVVEKNPKQSKWKEKHLELVTAIRAAKGVPDKMPSSPTPKPRSTTSLIASTAAHERCPSCDRHFGPKAFDRHVEWCKEKKARIQHSPANVQLAKERLEARVKYRVPPLNKSKRTLVREKYSGNSIPNSPEPVLNRNTTSTTTLSNSLSRGPSIRKPKSLVNVEKTPERTSRSDIEKCSGDKKRNSTEEDGKMSLSFGLPIIGSPSPKAESVKSLNKRNPVPSKKLNTVSINYQLADITVSSINNLEVNKRMVTWRDTVKKNSDGTVSGREDGIDPTESKKIPLKLQLEKPQDKTLVNQNTSECVLTFDTTENSLQEGISLTASKNVKKTKKLTKEKTFSLETSAQTPRRTLPSKRTRGFLDTHALSETKSVLLTSKDFSKMSVEKILSSNDVLHKTKVSKIPTKQNFKNLADVLNKYKRPPNKKSVEKVTVEEGVKKGIEDCLKKVSVESKTKLTNFEALHEESKDYKLQSESKQILNEKFAPLNLDENLKGVDDLSYSFEDEEEDIQNLHSIDNESTTSSADHHSDMNKWFEETFNEEPAPEERAYEREESENQKLLEEKEDLAFENRNSSADHVILKEEDRDELDQGSEKDSLEDATHKRDLRPLTSSGTEQETSKCDEASPDLVPNENVDKSTTLVYLFQSGTNLDLTRDNSQNTLTDKKSWSSVSTSNFEKEVNQISEETFVQITDSSNFSLKKSFSDINLLKNKSFANFRFGKAVVPLFLQKRFVFESDSVDFRKTCQDIRSISSVPSVHLADFRFKTEVDESSETVEDVEVNQFSSDSELKFRNNQNDIDQAFEVNKKVDWENVGSKERLEILRIAAEKFIEETKKKNCGGMSLTCVKEEDYTVPKKKRRLCAGDESDTILEDNNVDCDGLIEGNDKEVEQIRNDWVINESVDEDLGNFDENVDDRGDKKFSEDYTDNVGSKILQSVPNSAASSTLSEFTPRTLNLMEKIVRGKKLSSVDSNVLLAVTVSECEKLLEIDKKCLRKVEKKMAERGERDRVKLPLIVGVQSRSGRKKDQEVQVEFEKPEIVIQLPKINQRRMKQCSKDFEEGEKSELCIQSNASNYDPFEVAHRQFMELLECDDFKPFTPSPDNNPSRPHTTAPTPLTPSTPIPTKKAIKSADPVKKNKRASVIEPPVKFKDSSESATDNDDFELIENMINEHFGNEGEKNGNGFYLHNLKRNNKNHFQLEHILNNRKYSDDMSSSIDPSLINEDDNLSIPEHLKIDDYSPTSTVDTETTLQNDDVDHYSSQYDSQMESIEPKVDKKPLVKRSLSLVNRSKRDPHVTTSKTSKSSSNNNTTKKALSSSKSTVSKTSKSHVSNSSSEKTSQSAVKTEKKKGLPLLKRSMTLFDPSPKPSFKNKQEVNNYFNANELKGMSTSMTSTTNVVTSEKRLDKSNPQTPLDETIKAEDLFAVDDEMYEEYKKYEEMYLKEKEQNANSNKKNKNKNVEVNNYGLLTASEEEDHSNNSNNKLSNDSAYGSLRKTSKHRSRAPKLTPLEPKSIESTSSSGSENGLNSPAPPSSTTKVSKFCHECGTKFPVSTAKFCVECGVKRLVL